MVVPWKCLTSGVSIDCHILQWISSLLFLFPKRILKWLPEFVKGLLGCRCYGCYGSCVLGILNPLGFNKANYKMLFLVVDYFHFE